MTKTRIRVNPGEVIRSVLLAEGAAAPEKIQLLRVGKFKHPSYGEFEITPKILAEMVSNFDSRVRGIDIAFDYFHRSDEEASGWPKKLELSADKQELWALTEWTPRASKMIAEKEVRYFSPDFGFRWTDPETGKTYNNVLFGGGLTNRPFVKEMAAITADEGDSEMNEKEIAEMKAANLKLSEEKSALEKKLSSAPDPEKIKELEAKIAELQAMLDAEKKKGETLAAEKVKAEEAKALAEKESEFNVLLSEGKACAAQKEAFMKGDMKAFVANAGKVNTSGSGSGGGSGESDKGSADKEARVLKLAEEKRKADPKLSHGDSISLALKEVQ
jgi:phage I-like protein